MKQYLELHRKKLEMEEAAKKRKIDMEEAARQRQLDMEEADISNAKAPVHGPSSSRRQHHLLQAFGVEHLLLPRLEPSPRLVAHLRPEVEMARR